MGRNAATTPGFKRTLWGKFAFLFLLFERLDGDSIHFLSAGHGGRKGCSVAGVVRDSLPAGKNTW